MMLYRILFSALDNLLSEKVIQDAVLHTSVSEMILSFKKFLMTDIILCYLSLGLVTLQRSFSVLRQSCCNQGNAS